MIQFHGQFFWIFSQKRIPSDFEWISNIVIKTVTQIQSNYFWLTSSLSSILPFILLNFKNNIFVLKSILLVSIPCFIYPLKNPHRQNILEFPISSLRRYIWKIIFIKLSFLNELTHRDELGTSLKIFFSRFFFCLVWMRKRWTFLESKRDN